jgi:hypothetical protein
MRRKDSALDLLFFSSCTIANGSEQGLRKTTLHPADSGSPDMGRFRYPQPCALSTRPWKLLSVESFDGAAVSGHVPGACRVSALSTFTRPGNIPVLVGLSMRILVLNSRECQRRSHRWCCVKGRASAGFAQEAGGIETASWLETGALRGHIAIDVGSRAVM